jgi:hypothetical protein
MIRKIYHIFRGYNLIPDAIHNYLKKTLRIDSTSQFEYKIDVLNEKIFLLEKKIENLIESNEKEHRKIENLEEINLIYKLFKKN